MDVNMEWKQWLYGRKSKLREEDTDWNRWLLAKPERPFNPHVYLVLLCYKLDTQPQQRWMRSVRIMLSCFHER